ncbi:MAG: class I SAM-dependent methyltransferase [Vicinamibacteraceae bacterium]
MSRVQQSARAALGACYRRVAAPFGRRAIGRALADGLPPQLEPVLSSLFPPTPSRRDLAVARIEQRRAALATRSDRYGYVSVSTPQGPSRWAVPMASGDPGQPSVTARWLAQSASVPERWGRVLRACGDAAPRGMFLELGALAGISGAYLALGRGCERLLTIDGSPVCAALAAETLATLDLRAEVVEATFDAALDRLLGGQPPAIERISLAYVDGHHDGGATQYYAGRIAPALSSGGLLLLDDITLNSGMWAAWRALSTGPGWAAAVHLGRLGLLLRDGDAGRPRAFDFSAYTGWWPIGGARQTTTCPSEAQR